MKKKVNKELKKSSDNKILIYILQALAIIVIGFILLNITFMLNALYQVLLRRIISLFIPLGPELNIYWLPPLMHFSSIVIICIISWFILNSKLKTIYKAVYSVVPLAAIYATMGMLLYQWPILVYILGALFFGIILSYLIKTRQSLLYYFSLILITIVMFFVQMTGMEI